MAPRDSGIGTELDLELDEGSYEEEENMDEERWKIIFMGTLHPFSHLLVL